jgi:hypothetical protein
MDIQETKISSSWQLPVIVILALLALGALGFAWSISVKIDATNQAVADQMKAVQTSVQQDMTALKERLVANEKANTELQGDLKVVTDKLKITQGQLRRARQEAEAHNTETAQMVKSLDSSVHSELSAKATTDDVKDLDAKVTRASNDLEKTKNDLNMARSELGTRIARNQDEIGELATSETNGKNITLERYPNIESPDNTPVDRDVAVQVSLTRKPLSVNTQITQGQVTAHGALSLELPAVSESSWIIRVVLSAPGFQIINSTNFADITLPEAGDSTRALFQLKAKADVVGKTTRVMADFYYRGAYLATAARDISVGGPPGSSESMSPQSPSMERQASLPLGGNLAPDLTVNVRGRDNGGTSKNSTVYINSDYLQPAFCDGPEPTQWLSTQYEKMSALGAKDRAVIVGVQPHGGQADSLDFMRGFGRELYLHFAPPCFKEAFWKLVDKLGPRFRTIEIFTDDPSFPWELMRPVRSDKSGERDFIGLEFAVGRWHIDESGSVLDKPAQTENMETVSVIAPHYSGAQALSHQEEEVAALAKLNGYSKVSGTMDSSKSLFRNPPEGIIHFAGHGAIYNKGSKNETYAIVLEDGYLDLLAWNGIVSLTPHSHPLFFFNACDIGQAEEVLRFVDGWGPAVLRSGASGYIGALWSVNDTVAAEFAAQYYSDFEHEMLRGTAEPAEILMRTRKKVYESTRNPTALAYIFYGDANLRLREMKDVH